MAMINIERLALKLSGLSDSDGRRLVQLIAERLASATSTSENMYYINSLRVDATAISGNGVDMLSKQIVAEIVRQLESTL